MKILKIISKICVILAFVLFAIAPIMDSTSTDTTSSTTVVNPIVSTVITASIINSAYYYLFAGVGFVLILANINKLTKALGQGLLAADAMIGLVVFITINKDVAETNTSSYTMGFGTILILVAAIVYLTYAILDLVADAVNNIAEQKTSMSPALAEIKQWKELLDENIINEEEFNIKKQEILNLPKKN